MTKGASLSEIHDAALQRLRQSDQRYTPNRRKLVETLHEAPHPQPIGSVLEQAAGLAQSSTYRNLTVLENAGVVHRIVTGDDHARFELSEDVTGAHHHHLVCTQCGNVLDVALSDQLEDLIHSELALAAASKGFNGQHHRIDLIGECVTCV